MPTFVRQLTCKGRDNLKVVKPYRALGEHIVDHQIGVEHYRRIYDRIAAESTVDVVTRYYADDIVLTVRDDRQGRRTTGCTVTYLVDIIEDEEAGLQLEKDQYFNLSVTRFPKRLRYDHERQSVEITYRGIKNTRVILEILIPGINAPADIDMDVLKGGAAENIISLSYRIEMDPGVSETDLSNALEIVK